MNEGNIRKYAEMMKELELTGLEITEEGKTVRLERTPAAPVERIFYQADMSGFALGGAPGFGTGRTSVPDAYEQTGTPGQTVQSPDRVQGDNVTSPMVGVFYSSPAENADPFVKKGDRVKKGDTLCIIEAMKLMNEITAERDGVITDICADNGQIVDFGTVLFKIA